jgi:membrane associated rhomboid family serine protease
VESLREKFRVAPVTVSLAAACVVGYVLEVFLLSGARGINLSGWALSGQALAEGRWWTLVTHLFLHANLLHLMVNVLALWFVGPEVEFMLGRAKYVILYILSGVAGGLLQTVFAQPAAELVGASAAVCGVLLSFTTAYPEMPLRALLFFVLPVSMKAKTLGWGLIVVSLVCAVLHIVPQVGHLAHLGGALTGAFLTWWWLPRAPRRRPAPGGSAEQEVQTEELLARVVEEGIESLSREERRQLEGLARRHQRRW